MRFFSECEASAILFFPVTRLSSYSGTPRYKRSARGLGKCAPYNGGVNGGLVISGDIVVLFHTCY